MELVLTFAAVNMLFRVLANPESMKPDTPYKAGDDLACREVAKLQQWLREQGKTEGGFIILKEFSDGRMTMAAIGGTVKLKPRYIDRLKDMCKHYRGAGSLVHNVEGYLDLTLALEGKKFEMESVSE